MRGKPASWNYRDFHYRRGAVTSGHFLGRGKRRTVTVEMNGTKIGSGVFTCIPCVVPALTQALTSILAWYNESILNQPLSPLFCNCLQALPELRIGQVFGF